MYSLNDLKQWLNNHGVRAWVQGDVVMAECEFITAHGAVAVDKEPLRTLAQAQHFVGRL